MRDIINFIAVLLLLTTVNTSLLATVQPIELSDRISNSAKVIIAKITASESYWDKDHQNIYTSFTVEAKAYLKRNGSFKTFQLIVQGGEVDGDMEVVSPNIEMIIGQEYLLIVKKANVNILNPILNPLQLKGPQYQLYAHVQGALPYINGKYIDYIKESPMDEKTLLEKIKKITNFIATTPNGTIYNPREKIVDKDKDGVCSTLDCDDNDPNFPLPVGARCNDGKSSTKNDQIQADGCTCAGNPGLPVDCGNLVFTAEGGIIRIDNLTAKSEKIEFSGVETQGQSVIICDGNCDETQYIEGLTIGTKVLKIWLYGENETSCYKEVIIQIKTEIWDDNDNDKVCDIKDCDANNPNVPTIPGNPCDDGDSTTIRDIILADGCSCAGVTSCSPDQDLGNRASALVLKNGKGTLNPVFNAGTIEDENDLVIEGSGFGFSIGSIEFPNGNIGGRSSISIENPTDIISWSNSLIRVKIPSKAGTGILIIKNSDGILIGTAPIKIGWAHNSLYSTFKDFSDKTRQSFKFTNRNQAGGYTIQLHIPSGLAFSNAVVPLERAMDKWICVNGVNWQIDKSGTTTSFGNDGQSVVLYQPNLPRGTLAITTSRYRASGNSTCNLRKTVWFLKEFDIQIATNAVLIADGTSWNFGPWPPTNKQYDFETMILHELGHAHGLGHVIDEGDLLHYSIQIGQSNREISPASHSATAYKMALSSQPNCMTAHEPMTPLNLDCPSSEKNTSARVKILLEGYYDQTNGLLKTTLLDNNLIPSQQPFGTIPFKSSEATVISNFPNDVVDWLLIELRDENDKDLVIRQKPVLLKKDGMLVDLSGNNLLTFDNLDDKNYYIAIFHKSHLAIISRLAQPLSDNPTLFDFSNAPNTVFGDGQLKEINGKYFMTSGDFDGNGIINNQDFNTWKNEGASTNSYSPADADGNGIINNLDFNLWKSNGSKVSVLSRGN